MARKRSDIRTTVREVLRDEFVEGVVLDWKDDEINKIIRLTLDEIEQKMPYEARVKAYDALSTVATELSATATTLVVASDDNFSTTYPKYYTIEDEVVAITALPTADNFTITRAQLGTTAAIHLVGKNVGLSILTTADSKEIDLSNIADLIRLRKDNGVEYRVDKNPKQFRNWTRFADVLTLVINFLPSADEAVYLYCFKRHTLTDATSTLDTQHEAVLIQGVTARLAMNRGRELIEGINTGGVNVAPRMISWGKDQLGEYKTALKHHAIKDYESVLPKD